MAFDSLSEKLQNIFKNLRGKGRLSEADVKAALKEVKLALLEADVNFKVVKQFIKSVEERAIGQDVMARVSNWSKYLSWSGKDSFVSIMERVNPTTRSSVRSSSMVPSLYV